MGFMDSSSRVLVQFLIYPSAIGRSPFVALYGYEPRHFGIQTDSVVSSPDLDQWLQDRESMTTLINQHLSRSRDRMKRQADKNRSERSFQVGVEVFVKLQPYVQSSLAPRSNQKLAYKFFGPFRVLSRVGTMAYKLDLPTSSSIHLVFHVSRLKQAAPSDRQVTLEIPTDITQLCYPEQVLRRRRLLSHGTRPRYQVLVKWSGLPVSMAMWEEEERLCQEFSCSSFWGQAAAQRGDCYTTGPTIYAASRASSQFLSYSQQ
jgi:hypothetical protein